MIILELLKILKKQDDEIPVIMISGHANVQMAVDSLKLGAFEFIQKPFDAERILNFVNRAIENIDLKKEKIKLEIKQLHDTTALQIYRYPSGATGSLRFDWETGEKGKLIIE